MNTQSTSTPPRRNTFHVRRNLISQLDPLPPTPPRMNQARFPPALARKQIKPMDRDPLAPSRCNLETRLGATDVQDITGGAASDSD